MHVIVGQGQLDSILHATPEDRRGFIEEAAGVLKHRKRKEKALRKLDSTEGNLTRLQRPAQRDPPPAQAAGPAGRGGPPGRRRPGRRPRRPGPAARRRPRHRPHGAASRSSPTRRCCSSAGPRWRPRSAQARQRRGRARGRRSARTCPALARGAGDLVRAVRPARAAPRHRGAGRRAGPQRPRRRRAGDAGRAATPTQLEAEAERVRAQEREIVAEVERNRAALDAAARRPPARPSRRTPRRSAASPGCCAPPPTAARGWPGCTARSTR